MFLPTRNRTIVDYLDRLTTDSKNPGLQPYKFGGKEYDTMYGLNRYDFHARQKMSLLPFFTSIDPLAEKYPWINPYAYCNNNPINYIDPDGRQVVIPIPLPPPPVIGNTITGTDLKYALEDFGKGVVSLTQALFVNPIIMVGAGKSGIMVPISPGYSEQQKRERTGKEGLNQNQANVAKGIDANVTGTMPNGDPAPKRDPNDGMKGTKIAVGVAVTGGIVRAGLELTNPDPSKDAVEAHEQKMQQQSKQPQQEQQNNQNIWDQFKNWIFN